MKTSLWPRAWACLALCVIFLRELAKSSWSVAASAFARDLNVNPAIVAMPLRLRSDWGIATLANLVTLTPGTTSLHVSDDKKVLYVHCLNAASADAVIADIRQAFEDVIKEIEG